MQIKEYSTDIGGKTLVAQFTDLTDQANGSVIVRLGNTAVLATAVMSEHEREGMSYFPLSVEFEEKFYSAGSILGSQYVRREGRPSDEAVLSARVVDRTIRPLFNHRLRNDIQVVITVLSIDEYDPDVLAINAASLALATSDIPWNGPVSAVRIGKHKSGDALEVNPIYEYRDHSDASFDMIACGRSGNINMVEVGAHEESEDSINEALRKASEEVEKLQTFQQQIMSEIGKEKRAIADKPLFDGIPTLFAEHIEPKFRDAVFSGPGKKNLNELKKEWLALFAETHPDENAADADEYYEEKVDALLHKEAIDNDKRPDGRGMDDLRELYAQAGNFSPILHGSGIFYRGGTHVFSALTLGGPGDALVVNSIEQKEGKKRYMHHYNFPPFSAGETGRVGGFNRRMIGHGALAEKALVPVIPAQETFPYTIRIVSESMASNGSTSMASVCGSTLALMDAGVPIRRPVAGIASGLMMSFDPAQDKEPRYKVLTDIQGPEDHHGDMDFKVAGTREGVTAIQMDVKVDGVPLPILAEALEKAKQARLKILDVIEAEIAKPRESISPYAPEILITRVAVDQIGLVIGPGGKTINKIKDDTGVEEITIEDDGKVFITGRNGTAAQAKAIIESMTKVYEVGEQFDGPITRITEYGMFVSLGGGAEGLVHISEIAPFRIKTISGILKEGDIVPVVIKEIDEKKRINLSIKQRDPSFAEQKGFKPEKNEGRNGGRR